MGDRKSTRLNSSHVSISYAVFCLIPRPPLSTAFPYTTLFRSQLSRGGGAQALWRGDSKEVYYVSPEGKIMSVELKPGAILQTSAPKILFESRLRPDPQLDQYGRSEEHTSELQSRFDLVCRLLLDPASTALYRLSLHDALPISAF